jgi:hypothetical protein
MTPLDLVTILNAGIAGLALALRGNLLKPEAKAWASSRTASLVIMGLSVTMGGVAIDVAGRGGTTPREAAIVTAVALSAVAMLVHLWMQRGAPSAD